MTHEENQKLSHLLPDNEAELKDVLLKLNDSVDLGIISAERADEIVASAIEKVKMVIDPPIQSQPEEKIIVPVIFSDLIGFEEKYKLKIRPNKVTGKYDVFNSKDEHKLEFEFDSDKIETENYLKNIK